MNKSTNHKKIVTIIVTFVACIFIAIFFVFPIIPIIISNHALGINGILLLHGIIGITVILCLAYALKRRLEDLDNGEEDDLDKY